MSDFEYAYDDFRHDWPERVFGSETEYTVSALGNRAIHESFGDGSTRLIDFVDPQYAISPGRHENIGFNKDTHLSVITAYGGELYIDMGLLEYATGEADTPRGVILQERAGETITASTAATIAKEHPERFVDESGATYKRGGYPLVRDANGYTIKDEGSVGHHENYYSVSELTKLAWEDIQEGDTTAFKRDKINLHPSVRFMTSYLVLRKLFDGAGMVGAKGFSLTQKPGAFNLEEFDNSPRHGKKPAFWVHHDRFEVRTGENNKSDWVIEEKFGLTSLMLRMIEHDSVPRDLTLAKPGRALRDIAQNPHAIVQLKDGTKHKAVDVLKEMVDRAATFADSENALLPYEEDALTEFDRFYEDLKTVDLRKGTIGNLGYVDWAARFRFFTDRGATFSDMHTGNLPLVKYDLIWDQIRKNDIARTYLNRLGGAALSVPEPKPSARAKERIGAARKLYSTGNLYSVNWDRVYSTDQRADSLLPNPRGGNIRFTQ